MRRRPMRDSSRPPAVLDRRATAHRCSTSMTDDQSAAVTALAARRWRVALLLTAAMLAVYFGFILLIAFAKPFLAQAVTAGLTLGILLGVLVIASAWLLTWIYVRWANLHYDPALRAVRGRGRA